MMHLGGKTVAALTTGVTTPGGESARASNLETQDQLEKECKAMVATLRKLHTKEKKLDCHCRLLAKQLVGLGYRGDAASLWATVDDASGNGSGGGAAAAAAAASLATSGSATAARSNATKAGVGRKKAGDAAGGNKRPRTSKAASTTGTAKSYAPGSSGTTAVKSAGGVSRGKTLQKRGVSPPPSKKNKIDSKKSSSPTPPTPQQQEFAEDNDGTAGGDDSRSSTPVNLGRGKVLRPATLYGTALDMEGDDTVVAAVASNGNDDDDDDDDTDEDDDDES